MLDSKMLLRLFLSKVPVGAGSTSRSGDYMDAERRSKDECVSVCDESFFFFLRILENDSLEFAML